MSRFHCKNHVRAPSALDVHTLTSTNTPRAPSNSFPYFTLVLPFNITLASRMQVPRLLLTEPFFTLLLLSIDYLLSMGGVWQPKVKGNRVVPISDTLL
jgi:hypothetical protein